MSIERPMSKDNSTYEYKPLIHCFYTSPLSGEEIESRSMEIIEREVTSHHFNSDQWEIVRRMIHATGDLNIKDSVRFSPDAISTAIKALRKGNHLYVDSKMVQSGLSIQRLQSVCQEYNPQRILCYIDDGEVKRQARKTRLPRGIFAVRKAKPILDGAMAVFGNSPIALLELNRLIVDENIRPAVVIAMPVGFVHVEECKEELMSLNIPCIVLTGRRGGSPLAVSVIHALCTIAAGQKEMSLEKPAQLTKDSEHPRDEAIILMGHGSRVPGAGKDMEEVALRLKQRYGYPWVEICFVSRLGPHFPEIFEKCVNQGAKKVLAIPYFLHEGLHMLLDIPEMMQEAAQKFPHVKLILGKGLGFDEALVNLVQKRIEESKEFCDVRDLPIPKKEQYPLPPGQNEFVSMPPEEAAQYKRKSLC